MIIGAGLAGSTLAWRLDQLGHSYRIIDSPKLACASKVAAGLINPVTGKWMTKSWAIDSLMPLAREFYGSIEEKLGVALYQNLPIRRFFTNKEDGERAARRIRNPRYKKCVGSILRAGDLPVGIRDDLGSVIIEQGSRVDVPLLLDTLKNYFKAKGSFSEAEFQEEALISKTVSSENLWTYQSLNLEVSKVVFCQGIHALKNTYFKNLPLIPIKGDILSLKLPQINLPQGIYYKQRWLHSLDENSQGCLCRIGATYEDGISEVAPSTKAKEALIQSLKSILGAQVDYEIINHSSGIRPTTEDTRPLIIQHPEHASLFAINGLGSKGTSLAPLLSKVLLDYSINSKPLPTFSEDFK